MTSQIAVIRATLKYMTQEDFIKGMGSLITKRGLFIHTKSTRPVGSEIQFEFQLADGSIRYSGEGVVRKEIPYSESTATKSGMLISLRRVNRAFKEVVDIVLGTGSQEPSQVAPKPEEKAPEAEAKPAAPVRNIVENHAGSGIDIFGDMDMDEGLDSLFSSIEKPGAEPAPQKTQTSGMFEVNFSENNEPKSTSGWFENPEKDREGYQDTPTPQPTDYLASAYGEMNQDNIDRTQRKTGEYEAVEYIAEAERKLYSGQFAAVGGAHAAQEAAAEQEAAESENAAQTDPSTPSLEADFVNREVKEALNLMSNSPVVPTDSTIEMAPSSAMYNDDIGNAPTQLDMSCVEDVVDPEEPVGHMTEELASVKAQLLATAESEAREAAANAEAERAKAEAAREAEAAAKAEAEKKSEALFAALHDDILSEEKKPADNASPQALNLSSVSADAKDASPSSESNAKPELDFFNTPRARKNDPAQFEDLLKRAEIKTQDTQDIVMTNVSKKKAVARRRVVAEEAQIEIPQEKKGFFSSLFKK